MKGAYQFNQVKIEIKNLRESIQHGDDINALISRFPTILSFSLAAK